MIKFFIVISFILKTIYKFFLTFLNIKGANRNLPENVKDIYDEKEFNKWKSYNKENIKLGILENIFDFILNFCLLSFNIYAIFFYLFNVNDYYRYFWLIIILSIISNFLSIPFDYYDTFFIEEKYGMNKTTKKTFILDKVKSFILEIILSFLLIFIIKYLYDKFGNRGTILIIVSIVGLMLLITISIMQILKLFNKFTPLEDGELKDKLISLCEKHGIKVKKIVVKNASLRTTKSNAFCTGLGKTKTISLDDNLLKNFSNEEILAVFAHEEAHAKFKHLFKTLPFTIINIAFMIVLFIIILNFEKISLAFGFKEMNYYISFLVLELIIWPFEIFINFLGNYLSRKHEYEADNFAVNEGYGEFLISALKKLHKESLSNINPHPVIVKLNYSHPTLSERITAIKKNFSKI